MKKIDILFLTKVFLLIGTYNCHAVSYRCPEPSRISTIAMGNECSGIAGPCWIAPAIKISNPKEFKVLHLHSHKMIENKAICIYSTNEKKVKFTLYQSPARVCTYASAPR